MCIRDSHDPLPQDLLGGLALVVVEVLEQQDTVEVVQLVLCLLYTSDAADERSSVDLGGRRIIKKKNRI